MYYHARPIKYVRYGKVYGNPEPGGDWDIYYRWLSNYCGYFPQVWLSRSRSRITGIRREKDAILFGFDVIRGFPLHYNWWEMIMGHIWRSCHNGLDPVKDVGAVNDALWKAVKSVYERDYEYYSDEEWQEYVKNTQQWIAGDPNDYLSADEWLRKCVFVKRDQVVVPSLNLKSAKEVFCRSSKEKKKLRKMGFIEDRIRIRKFPNPWE